MAPCVARARAWLSRTNRAIASTSSRPRSAFQRDRAAASRVGRLVNGAHAPFAGEAVDHEPIGDGIAGMHGGKYLSRPSGRLERRGNRERRGDRVLPSRALLNGRRRALHVRRVAVRREVLLDDAFLLIAARLRDVRDRAPRADGAVDESKLARWLPESWRPSIEIDEAPSQLSPSPMLLDPRGVPSLVTAGSSFSFVFRTWLSWMMIPCAASSAPMPTPSFESRTQFASSTGCGFVAPDFCTQMPIRLRLTSTPFPSPVLPSVALDAVDEDAERRVVEHVKVGRREVRAVGGGDAAARHEVLADRVVRHVDTGERRRDADERHADEPALRDGRVRDGERRAALAAAPAPVHAARRPGPWESEIVVFSTSILSASTASMP